MRAARDSEVDLLADPPGTVLLRLTAPMTLALFATTATAVVDALFVARLGRVPLAALGFAVPVALALTNVAMGLGVGVAAVVAHRLGVGSKEGASRVAGHALELALLLAFILGLLGWLSIRPLFRALGAPPAVLAEAASYMAVWYTSLPLSFLLFAANSALRAQGNARLAAQTLLVAAGGTALLDPLLIFGFGPLPALGLPGAAWAVLLARGLAAALALTALARRLGGPAAEERSRFAAWRELLAISLPATASRLAFPVSMALITALVARHGPAAVAALGVAGRIENLVMIVVTSLSSALLPFVGQNWAAGRADRARAGLVLALRFVLAWGGAVFLLLLLAGRPLLSLFTSDAAVAEVATLYLQILSLGYGLQGVSAMMSSALNGLRRPLAASAITFLRMFGLYLPLAWVGEGWWGLPGIFLGGAAATLATGAVAFAWGRTQLVAVSRPAAAIAGFALLVVLPSLAAAQAPARFKTILDFPGMERYTIMEIQGVDQFSPIAGQFAETSGVVTLWAANGTGFWLQDPRGDGDPATSDGIFVSWDEKSPRTPPPEKPAVGDRIEIVARVDEEMQGIALPRTRFKDVARLKVLARSEALPAPVPVERLPAEQLADAARFWEPLEGMRVHLAGARVIAPTNRNGEFAVLTAANAVPGSGFFPAEGVLIMRSLGGDRVDANPEAIVLDDLALGSAPEVRPGDELGPFVGVVDFAGRTYKIQPEALAVTKRREMVTPASRRSGPKGNVRITDYNLSSFFDTVDNPDRFDENSDPGSQQLAIPTPEQLDLRVEKFARSIIEELELPDVILSQEFETTEIFQLVGDRVNTKAGTRYRAVSKDTSDRRGLEVGFLYDEARVELVEVRQLGGPEVAAAFGFGSPFRNREPLLGVFRFASGGPPVTIIANKMKSKRNDAPVFNVNPTPVRITERQRKAQARALRQVVNGILEKDPNALLMVAGDLGDFAFAEPGEGEDHPLAILAGGKGEIPLTNLLELEAEADRYNWLFNGSGQVLSHMLVSPALGKRCVAVDFLHFNAPFPERLAGERDTALRASDRDPLEARFDLR